jgi:RNA polymerase sigma factor (sigma-70 family)
MSFAQGRQEEGLAMAGATLGVALRQIQWLFSDGSAVGAPDTQLLGRFATYRDEGAFTALMARHGPMVMTVCRGVLRDSLDAEDAFQATFLVLARKAGSAWAEGQLGGWLHRVAYRIAVRASVDTTRRRMHERRAAEVAAMGISQVNSDDELQPALHEELARLPAKLRVPVVLCYLEGLTHAQAALQLRCGEATVRRRLAGARDRLRNRLVRRGFAPVASALVLSITREARAVPCAVAGATLRAAVRVAAGEAVAVVAGARLAGLTRVGLNAMTDGWKATAYLTLAVAGIACAGAGVGVLGGKIAGGSTEALVEPVPHTQAQAESPPRQKSTQKHAIKGMVLAPDGKPLPGAEVFWLGLPRFEPISNVMPKRFKDRPEDFARKLALARTDAEGRFELAAEFDARAFTGREVVVKAKGVGVAGRVFFGETVSEGAGEEERLEFRLRKPVTIEGRLLAPTGAPAKGVEVSLGSFSGGENEPESDGVGVGGAREGDEFRPEYWPKPWTTDSDGRFRIEGIVPEKMVARLYFHHPDFADDDLFVSTGGSVDASAREFNVKPVDARFTHILEPARPVTGVVSDKETGRPLAGVLVEMMPLRTTRRHGGSMQVRATTDASGRYRAAGEFGEIYQVTAFPEPESGYLSLRMQDNRWPIGARTLNVDLALPKGRVIRGRVFEGDDGQPLAGASVIYQPGPTNPVGDGDYDFENPVLTDKSGKFALTALPGRGLLGVEGPTGDYIRVAIAGPEKAESPIARPHGFAWIDVPEEKDKEVPDANVTLRKGVKLEARIVGPDNSPVKNAMGWCAEMQATQLDNWVSPSPISDGRFELEGADPERSYRAFFVDPKRKLGAVANLRCDAKGPVVVRLEPTATAKGTMVDEKGKPLEGSQILPWIVLTRDDRELKAEDFRDESMATAYAIFTQETLPDSHPAEFKYDNLIPGLRYYVGSAGTYHPIPALKPGEVRNLGKIVVKPPKEDE